MLVTFLSVSNLQKHTKNHGHRVDDFDVILLDLSNCEIGKKRTLHGLCHWIENLENNDNFYTEIFVIKWQQQQKTWLGYFSVGIMWTE